MLSQAASASLQSVHSASHILPCSRACFNRRAAQTNRSNGLSSLHHIIFRQDVHATLAMTTNIRAGGVFSWQSEDHIAEEHGTYQGSSDYGNGSSSSPTTALSQPSDTHSFDGASPHAPAHVNGTAHPASLGHDSCNSTSLNGSSPGVSVSGQGHAALTYKRVMLKISGEALQGTQGFGIDPAVSMGERRERMQ